MYVVVIGLGEVGRHLLKSLSVHQHDVVAVDSRPDAVLYAEEQFDVMTLVGYGASQKTLDDARVAHADLVVAVTDNDEINLIAALAAKQLGAKRVIARVQGNQWLVEGDGVSYGMLGVDVVINPRVLVAIEFARIARSHGALEVIDLADHRVELVQVELDEESRGVLKPLARLQLPEETLVAAVVRAGRLFVPGGADVLQAGDRVYLIGLSRRMNQAEDLFTSNREAHRVCIVGGGVVGEMLAKQLLSDDAEILLIEDDAERAEALAAELPRATVLQGDGTDLSLLKEEEVGTYDLFLAVTDDDEINLMASLLARRAGAPRTAVLVHRADYSEIYRQLGVDIVLSPRTVAADHILKYVRGAAVERLAVLEDGQAEVLELIAQDGSRVVGAPIHRLDLPRGTLLAAVVHQGKVTVPRGDYVIQGGDTVVALVTNPTRGEIERLFKKRTL